MTTATATADTARPRGDIALDVAAERRGTIAPATARGARRGLGGLAADPHQACDFLKIFGNEGRLQVLSLLAEGERTVGEMERLLGIRQSALSQHLARLRAERIVTPRRDGKNVIYSLTNPRVRAVLDLVHGMFCHDGCDQDHCAMKSAPRRGAAAGRDLAG